MAAEGAGSVMVLAMDIVGERAADGDEAGAGRDRRKPAGRHGELQQAVEQQAGPAGQQAGFAIEEQDFVHSARVDQRAALVQAGIAVGAAIAVGERRPPMTAGGIEPIPRIDDLAVAGREPAPGTVIGEGSCHGRSVAAIMIATTSRPMT